MTPEIEFRITAKNTLRIIAVKSSKISKMNEVHKYVVENVKETRRSRGGESICRKPYQELSGGVQKGSL